MTRSLYWDMGRCLLLVGLSAAALMLCLNCMTGCTPPASAREAAAEATYLGQQLRCVDESDTLAAAQECRRHVREQWGISETARDAGGER